MKCFKIMWWNVNKRLAHILKYDNNPLQEDELDMFFVSETCLGHGGYPVFKDFTVISDPTVKACQHGGFAWYVKDSLCGHLIGVTYGSSFVAFSLDIFPHVVFVGIYIKPEGSQFFDPTMFNELGSYIMDCHERNKIVFIGGDLTANLVISMIFEWIICGDITKMLTKIQILTVRPISKIFALQRM